MRAALPLLCGAAAAAAAAAAGDSIVGSSAPTLKLCGRGRSEVSVSERRRPLRSTRFLLLLLLLPAPLCDASARLAACAACGELRLRAIAVGRAPPPAKSVAACCDGDDDDGGGGGGTSGVLSLSRCEFCARDAAAAADERNDCNANKSGVEALPLKARKERATFK